MLIQPTHNHSCIRRVASLAALKRAIWYYSSPATRYFSTKPNVVLKPRLRASLRGFRKLADSLPSAMCVTAINFGRLPERPSGSRKAGKAERSAFHGGGHNGVGSAKVMKLKSYRVLKHSRNIGLRKTKVGDGCAHIARRIFSAGDLT